MDYKEVKRQRAPMKLLPIPDRVQQGGKLRWSPQHNQPHFLQAEIQKLEGAKVCRRAK